MNFKKRNLISTFLIITLGTILVLYFILYLYLFYKDFEKNDMNLNITNIYNQKVHKVI